MAYLKSWSNWLSYLSYLESLEATAAKAAVRPQITKQKSESNSRLLFFMLISRPGHKKRKVAEGVNNSFGWNDQ